MRQINKDRQRRVLLLSNYLKEIAAVRNSLVVQLEDLERQEEVVEREFNALHNLDAAISTLPGELLVMIFEAGTLLEENHCHFGTLVSRVTHHWRHIALETPLLWNKISFTEPGGLGISLSARSTERAIKRFANALVYYLRDPDKHHHKLNVRVSRPRPSTSFENNHLLDILFEYTTTTMQFLVLATGTNPCGWLVTCTY